MRLKEVNRKDHFQLGINYQTLLLIGKDGETDDGVEGDDDDGENVLELREDVHVRTADVLRFED